MLGFVIVAPMFRLRCYVWFDFGGGCVGWVDRLCLDAVALGW